MQLQIGRPCGNTATVGNIPDAYNFTTEKEIDSRIILSLAFLIAKNVSQIQ